MKYLLVIAAVFGLCRCICAADHDYPVTKAIPLLDHDSTASSFDPRDIVMQLRQSTPEKYCRELQQWPEHRNSSRCFRASYRQKVREYISADPLTMVVELTRIIIDVPYDSFIRKIPPETWGEHLSGYLGGEVVVMKRDEQSRATHQVERMVLKAPIKNLDMTKTEVIVYEQNRATVYWRVFHSENRTTKSDIGYVEFAGIGNTATMVTFQSAHKLYLPNFIVKWNLANTFARHLENYQSIVTVK
jgi:hypothetical protein